MAWHSNFFHAPWEWLTIRKWTSFSKKNSFLVSRQVKWVGNRHFMGSTDQADPSCFYFRISWRLIEENCFYCYCCWWKGGTRWGYPAHTYGKGWERGDDMGAPSTQGRYQTRLWRRSRGYGPSRPVEVGHEDVPSAPSAQLWKRLGKRSWYGRT